MQRRVRDDDAAHGHRRQPRDRRERPGATDLNVDPFELRPGKFGGEFMRDRPTRRGRAEAQTPLQREVVHLVDDAVDIVAERGPLGLDLAVMGEHVGGAVA